MKEFETRITNRRNCTLSWRQIAAEWQDMSLSLFWDVAHRTDVSGRHFARTFSNQAVLFECLTVWKWVRYTLHILREPLKKLAMFYAQTLVINYKAQRPRSPNSLPKPLRKTVISQGIVLSYQHQQLFKHVCPCKLEVILLPLKQFDDTNI